MPHLHLEKKWTPLELFGIRIFVSSEKVWYIKIGKKHMRRIIRRKKGDSHVKDSDLKST